MQEEHYRLFDFRGYQESSKKWKDKYAEKQHTIKLLKLDKRDLEASRGKWRADYKALKAEVDAEKKKQSGKIVSLSKSSVQEEASTEEGGMVKWMNEISLRVRHHSYDSDMMVLCVSLILLGGICYRACSRVLRLLFGTSINLPTRQTISNWLVKVGYYQLEKAVEKAPDWLYIVDVSHGFGHQKCLVVLGIRLSVCQGADFTWSYDQLTPLASVPCETITGPVVYEVLERCKVKTGGVAQIVSDKGPDVYKGICLFLAAYPNVIWIYDVGHQMANLLKGLLEGDEMWQGFLGATRRFKHRVQQTVVSFLSPPTQRTKARYMNIGLLTDWACGVFNYLSKKEYSVIDIEAKLTNKERKEMEALLDDQAKADWLDQKRATYLKGRLGDLVDYEKVLPFFTMAWEMTKLTNTIIKKAGLSPESIAQVHTDLHQLLLPLEWQDYLVPFRAKIIASLKAYLPEQIQLGACFVATSDIIESLFGKFKKFTAQGAFVGLTKQTLLLPAFTMEVNRQNIIQAITEVKMKDIEKWKDDFLPMSIHALKMDVFDRRKRQPIAKVREIEQPQSDRKFSATA